MSEKSSLSIATPHTSTPNVNAVRHADSHGSLLSTDSGNSFTEKNSEKIGSGEKVRLSSPSRSSFLSESVLLYNTFTPNLATRLNSEQSAEGEVHS